MRTSEGLKQSHFEASQVTTQKKDELTQAYERIAVQYAQSKDLPMLRQFGQRVIAEEKALLTDQIAQVLQGKVPSPEAFVAQLERHGYQVERGAPRQTVISHAQTGTRFLTTELEPNGRAFAPQLEEAVKRTIEQAKTQTESRGMRM